MKKQAIVIGLGHFGMSLARALSERGVEVLAVDRREELVRIAADFVVEAICFDATDAEALARISPDRREACICAIGDESKESSIICTAMLRQMGAKRVIARANDDLHERILKLVGAHVVVNPERQFGESFASHVVHESVLGEFQLGGGLTISEFRAPSVLVGHTLSELQLQRRFGITVMAVRRDDQKILLPDAHQPLTADDVLVVVSKEGAVAQLLERS
jgi:trk system potassium uptake protein TrkA